MPECRIVKLIQINQSEESQLLLASCLSGQFEAVRIVVFQRIGHQQFAESGFASSLFAAHQHGSYGVGTPQKTIKPTGVKGR